MIFRIMNYTLIYLCAFLTGFGTNAFAGSAVGVRNLLEADISILGYDGLPLANEEVFLAESIGGIGPVLSERMYSDQNGQIYLNGYYCLPMVIAINSGYISITRYDIREKYTIKKTLDGVSIEKSFGKPDEYFLKKINEYRKTCR